MRIIDEKAIEYITVCPECQSKLAYTSEDIWTIGTYDGATIIPIIYCPKCGKSIRHNFGKVNNSEMS